MNYYRIDVIDENDESNGYSLCIKSKDKLGDDAVDYAVKNGLIDKYDLKEYNVSSEDITNDDYELHFWLEHAVSID